MAIPAKIDSAPSSATTLTIAPLIKLAMALLVNQSPINREEYLTGANFETIDKPIGERQSSPMV